MPTYIRPARVDITEGGGGPVLILAGLAAIGAVVAFILAHLLLLGLCAAVAAAVLGTVLVLMRRAARPELAEQHFAAHRAALPAAVRAISAPRRAIEAQSPQHLHLHFHGLSTEDAATIIRRAETPARPAIEEDR